jgi:hypothetical protein
MALVIRDWHKHFYYKEANDAKYVIWRKHPVSHNSVRFRRLMREANGRTAYVVFVVIVDLCARARSDGVLMDGEQPIDAETVNLATGIPIRTCKQAIDLLCSPEVEWLLDSESIENREAVDSVSNTEQSRAEQSREEKKKAEPSHASDSSASRSCPAPPGQHYTVEYARQCLIGVGISSLEAEAVVSDALVKYPNDGLARIVKGCTRLVGRLRKGKPVENKVNYVQVAGELKKSAKQQVADAKANVAAQVRLVKGQGAA